MSNPPHFKYVLGTDNLGLLDEPRHSEMKRHVASLTPRPRRRDPRNPGPVPAAAG